MTRGATRGTRRDARPRRRLRRELRRAAAEAPRRDDRLARELHALHAAAARGGVGDDRAATRASCRSARCARTRSSCSATSRATTASAGPSSSRSLAGELEIGYERLVVALGAITRDAARSRGSPSTASASRTSPTRSRCATASSCSSSGRRSIRTMPSELGFVFVGAGYAGVEALAELNDMAHAALRYYPTLRDVPQRWVLVDAAPKILPEIPRRLGEYAARRPRRSAASRSTSARRSSRTTAREAVLSDGDARSRANARLDGRRPREPAAREPRASARRARARRRRRDASRRGDRRRLGARRLRGRAEHARRRASSTRRRASTRSARRGGSRRTSPATPKPYGYRMLGQVATLGRFKGIAEIPGVHLWGFPGWFVTRTYHLYQLPLLTPKAPRRRRLDGRAVLPPRHRRAVDARPSASARRLGSRDGGDVRSDPRRRRERMGLAPGRSGVARAGHEPVAVDLPSEDEPAGWRGVRRGRRRCAWRPPEHRRGRPLARRLHGAAGLRPHRCRSSRPRGRHDPGPRRTLRRLVDEHRLRGERLRRRLLPRRRTGARGGSEAARTRRDLEGAARALAA